MILQCSRLRENSHISFVYYIHLGAFFSSYGHYIASTEYVRLEHESYVGDETDADNFFEGSAKKLEAFGLLLFEERSHDVIEILPTETK